MALFPFEMLGLIEVTLVLCFVYWFFAERAHKMVVDVISNHLQVWRQGPSDSGPVVGQRPMMRQPVPRRRSNLDKDGLAQIRENHLYQIKEAPTKGVIMTAQPRPFMGLCCTRCTPTSRESLIGKDEKSQNVINILQFGRTFAQKNGFVSRTFCDIAQAFRVRRFQYEEVSQKVINDDRLKHAIEQVTQETVHRTEDHRRLSSPRKNSNDIYSQTYKADENRAKMIIQNMRSALSHFWLRLTSWTLYKLLPYFITSISASPTQLEMLKKAGDTGLPLIFMPLHRSHLDYILVTFILLNNNIRSPLVAAGDNLKIPLFGWLLRGLGAFYIKRRLENDSSQKDMLYRAALHTYIMHCLRAKHNIEFYIEGGRSRTGKPLLPKSGILSVIVDAYLDGTIEDALLVPVSMNYDKIVDGNFVREQTGQPKQMESFSMAISSIWKVLNSHYGSIRIDFNQPFSIQELVRTFQQHQSKLSPPPLLREPSFDALRNAHDINGTITIKKLSMERTLSSRQSCSSLYGTDVAVEEQRGLIEAIGKHIVYDSTCATAVMSTNAIAHILLTWYRNGCTITELTSALSSLTFDLKMNNKDVGYSGEPLNVVNHALSLLGPELIIQEGDIIKPVLTKPNVIELSYYSYGLAPHFAIQSIVATAIQMFVSESLNSSSISIRHKGLVDVSLELCEVLSQEFILSKPCQQLDVLIEETIDYLISKGIISTLEEPEYDENQQWSRRFAATLDDDEYCPAEQDQIYFVAVTEDAIRMRHRLMNVIRPLIEIYSITALCLPKILTVDNRVAENNFVNSVLDQTARQLVSGECKYGEALSTDAIKNCIRLFRQWGILDAQMEGKTRTISVQRQHRNQQNLNKIYNEISKFKTEMPTKITR